LLVYNGSVNFIKTGQSCLEATGYSGCWGRSTGRNSIEVYTDAGNKIPGDVHWAVHELGHSFVNATGSSAPNTKYEAFQRRFGYPDRGDKGEGGNCITVECGFAGGPWEWQRSVYGDTSEECADMYLGWVYGQWENATAGWQRSKYMNFAMPVYIERAVNNR
jgi:hypothetical protein